MRGRPVVVGKKSFEEPHLTQHQAQCAFSTSLVQRDDDHPAGGSRSAICAVLSG